MSDSNSFKSARPSTRRGFIGLLAAMAGLFGTDSREWRKAKAQGYRHGKHNGRNPGAFGGRAKWKR